MTDKCVEMSVHVGINERWS